MNGKGRALANRSWKEQRITDNNIQKNREQFGVNMFECFSYQDLEKLTPKTRTMLENNTATLKKCLKCHRVLLLYKKTLLRYMGFLISKYGGYVCKPCHTGQELPKEEDRQMQQIFKEVYERWKNNVNKTSGVKTTNI